MGQRGSDRPQYAEVLDDDRVDAHGPCGIDHLQRGTELVRQDHHIGREVDARLAQVRKTGCLGERLEIEVRGPSPRVQLAQSEVDGIGPVVDRSNQRLGPPCGREQLHSVVCFRQRFPFGALRAHVAHVARYTIAPAAFGRRTMHRTKS